TDFDDITDTSTATSFSTTTDSTKMSTTMLGTTTTALSPDASLQTAQTDMIAPILLEPTIITANPSDFATGKTAGTTVCPGTAPKRKINVTAVNAWALPTGTLVYNSRAGNGGALNDPTAIMYFRTEDIDSFGNVKAGVPIEPLVVRARAGECIQFNLEN